MAIREARPLAIDRLRGAAAGLEVVGRGVHVGVGEGFVGRLDDGDGALHEALGDDVAVIREGDGGCWDGAGGEGLADDAGADAVLVAEGGGGAVLGAGCGFGGAELGGAGGFEGGFALELFLEGDVQDADVPKLRITPSAHTPTHTNSKTGDSV